MTNPTTLHALLDPTLPAMCAHGARHLIAYLDGRLSLEGAIARGKTDTRRYAKRQSTFARHQLSGFQRFPGENAVSDTLAIVNARLA